MNKDIFEFIENFRSKHSDFQYLFTNGLCYHFAAILKNIFVGHIVYNDIDNHFAFYSSKHACIVDITGIISPNGFVKWDDYIEREKLNSNRVVKECVMLKGQQ